MKATFLKTARHIALLGFLAGDLFCARILLEPSE